MFIEAKSIMVYTVNVYFYHALHNIARYCYVSVIYPSVMLRYHNHMGCVTLKLFTRIISLGFSLYRAQRLEIDRRRTSRIGYDSC